VSLAETSEFESQYGHSDDCLLSDALWTCSNMFDTAYVVVTDTVVPSMHMLKLCHCLLHFVQP